MVSQVRKSAVSMPSNIAEGYGRNSTNEYIRFLQISSGSLYELQTQLLICLKLRYLSKETFESTYEKSREIERIFSRLIKKLDKNN